MQAAGGTSLTDDPAVSGSAIAQAGRRRVGALLAVAAAVLAADIITKTIVVATLSDRSPVQLLGGLVKLTVSRNPGAAFSIGPSVTVLFSAIALGVIVFILRASRRIRSLVWAVSLGLLLGGATGNLTDRLFRYPGPFRGYVVDWIWLPHWPVFNLADSSIVCGGVLAVLLAVRGVHIDGSRAVGRELDRAGSGGRPPESSRRAGSGGRPPESSRRAGSGGRPPESPRREQA